jgi:hypothetical protein
MNWWDSRRTDLQTARLSKLYCWGIVNGEDIVELRRKKKKNNNKKKKWLFGVLVVVVVWVKKMVAILWRRRKIGQEVE